MRINVASYCNSQIFPRSTIKIIRKNQKEPAAVQSKKSPKISESHVEENPEYRENDMKIQMLSKSLFTQIFKNNNAPNNHLSDESLQKLRESLLQHGISGESPKLPDINLQLPLLNGENIEEHFLAIATEQIQPYKVLLDQLLSLGSRNIKVPDKWVFEPGWTRYDAETNVATSVQYPSEDAIIFDIEVCMQNGKTPTIACALGKNGWYSWTSSNLINISDTKPDDSYSQLIPFESTDQQNSEDVKSSPYLQKPKIIVGHNVSYDRARIKEQYWTHSTGTRFLDTMSLHTCVSGVTSYQKAILKSSANKELSDDDLQWSSQSSLSNLADVYKLYCEGQLDKEKRNIFVEGTMMEIREEFQNLMTYCSKDVLATFQVLYKLYPLFNERFPHPATLAGMLEIGMAYLPINSNWKRYINESNLTYEDFEIEAKHLLKRRADNACRLLHNNAFEKDLWMWDEDWTQQKLKFLKQKPKKSETKSNTDIESSDDEFTQLSKKFQHLYEKAERLPKKRPLLPGYPEWYRNLCNKPSSPDWVPGPYNIGTGMQVAPKLLSLCWEGYPLHYIRGQGWGFLVPHKSKLDVDDPSGILPLAELVKKCPIVEPNCGTNDKDHMDAFVNLSKNLEQDLGKREYWRGKTKAIKTQNQYKGNGVWSDIELEKCCWFVRLPHKNGPSNKVGNPLARDFLNKFSENVLSGDGVTAEKVIKLARMMSYWRNNRDRITNQMTVWVKRNDNIDYGAIVPQVVVCGTLTRRAMEPTWMTASNAQPDRVGSELRSMVQSPPGYKFVGADVDSQELWISSILGDSSAALCHGATPFGWMTLSGTKSNSTDMHSITAKAIGISRDHAKVLNYARIYGAGQQFSERLLKQFKPSLSDGEARSKAAKMFAMTKGKKVFYLLHEHRQDYINKGYSKYEAMKLCAASGLTLTEMFYPPKWTGGTESAMFNRLEEIAEMDQPTTPFLNGRLSRALEPHPSNQDRYLPTRVNWVVQSGAVDFLHLMLVCMRWLMGENIRFCLSFHDEVRYLVPNEHAYKAALAMHITNLLTRSFCAHRIGLNDLPQSVAFFTSVEIDTVLRKDAHVECVTPSNPHGLTGGYGIPLGEALDIKASIEKCDEKDMTKWRWHQKT